jgi:hypothetical protein
VEDISGMSMARSNRNLGPFPCGVGRTMMEIVATKVQGSVLLAAHFQHP